jgi:hypothetical protein
VYQFRHATLQHRLAHCDEHVPSETRDSRPRVETRP